MHRLRLLKEYREQILKLARANRAEQVFLFGSYARGTQTAVSDVDFLVSFRPEATLFDHARLEAELSELLGKTVDVVSASVLKEDAFGAQVRKEAIAI